ncbi:MAG: hypothetical protein RLZZ165_1078 [Bacteroidota bacterium]
MICLYCYPNASVSSGVSHRLNKCMKRAGLLTVLAIVVSLLHSAWASAPGGDRGGGGRSAAQHPAPEAGVRVQPAPEGEAGDLNLHRMEHSGEAPDLGSGLMNPGIGSGKDVKEVHVWDGSSEEQFVALAKEAAHKKEVRRHLKEAIQNYRDARQKMRPEAPLDDSSMLLYVVLAVLLPPLAVYLYTKKVGIDFWICLILTILGWLPGIVWALYVILAK